MRISDVEVGKEYATDTSHYHTAFAHGARYRVEAVEAREVPRRDRYAWNRTSSRTEKRRGVVLQRLDTETGEPYSFIYDGETVVEGPKWHEGARMLGQPWEEYAAERDAQKARDDRREAALERLADAVEYVLGQDRTDVRLTYGTGRITVVLDEKRAIELAEWMEKHQ